MAKIDQCIADGVNFTQESTLAGSYVRKVAKAAKEAGFYIRLFYVGLDTAEEALKRIQNRIEKGGIPEDVVRRRFEQQIGALAEVLPYYDEAIFFDNRNGFVEVASYRNGEILPIGNGKQPLWLEKLLQIQVKLAYGTVVYPGKDYVQPGADVDDSGLGCSAT